MDGGKIGKFLVVWGVGSSMGEYGTSVLGGGEVLKRCGKVYGVSVEGVGKCVGVWRRVEKSGEV